MFGTAASYLPGRRISGLRVLPDGRLEVHVVMAWGSTVDDVEASLLRALEDPAELADLVIEDLSLPSGKTRPRSLPGRRSGRDVDDTFACGALLGVEPTATAEDVNAAFRRYVAAHHPDRGGDGTHIDEAVRARRVLLRTASAPTRHRHFYKQRSWWRHLTARRSR